jgi:hypothetical protein
VNPYLLHSVLTHDWHRWQFQPRTMNTPNWPDLPAVHRITETVLPLDGPEIRACRESHRERYSPAPGSVSERELCEKYATQEWSGD